MKYFQDMEQRYTTLMTIYKLVITDAQPCNLPCSPRDIILHQPGDSGDVSTHILALASEKLITVHHAATVTIRITPAGVEKATTFIEV